MTKVKFVNWKLVTLVYIFSVVIFSLTARANQLTWMPSESPEIMPKNMRLAAGEIAFDLDGKPYLFTNQNEVFELVSENLDLSELEGVFVRVKGFEPRHSTGPVYRSHSSLVPLTDSTEEATHSAPVFVVVSVTLLE